MTAALDAIRARHVPAAPAYPDRCAACCQPMPCDFLEAKAALDRAGAVVDAYREFWHAHWDAMLHEDENVLSPMHSARVTRLRRATDAVRVLDFGDKPLWPYEDADKVADIAEAAWEETP